MKKVILFIIAAVLLLLVLLYFKQGSMEAETQQTHFYLGTYTNTESQGIYTYALSDDGAIKQVGLAVRSENPSFLARSVDNKFIIAVNENTEGTVSSFEIQKDSLSLIDKRPSGGAHPCFVATNDQGQVLTANYSSGTIGFLQIDDSGALTNLLDVQQHSGKGSHPRQDAPHAHSVWFEPGTNTIISIDLGTNELLFSTIDPETIKLLPASPNALQMDPGAGPRHLSFHPKNPWIYVVNELTSSVSLVVKDTSGYKVASSFSTLPEGFQEENTCADIHISDDGNFLYASNRGHNSIAIFSIEPNGDLKIVGHESTRGNGPRNFALSPDNAFLLVANQLTDNIVSFKRYAESGKLEYITEVSAPTPVCILF